MRLHQPVSASRTISRVEGADRPHCMTCRLLVRLACALSLPRLLGHVVQADSCDEISLYQSCRKSEFTESCLTVAPIEGLKQSIRPEQRGGKKKVPRRKARHCSVRGDTRAAFDRARDACAKTSSALAIVTAPTPRALLAGRAAGDSPVPPSRHGLHNPSRRLTPPWPSPHGSRSRPSAAATGSRKARARVPSGGSGCRPSVPA